MAYNPNNSNGQKTMANSAPVVLASDQSSIPVTGAVTISAALPTGANVIGGVTGTFFQATQPTSTSDITSSGTITALNGSVALALNGQSGATIQITGTWVATLQFEGTVDGTNWSTINGVYAGTSTPGPTISANGLVRLTPSGIAQFRITATAFTSGTATISMRASSATGGTFLNQSLTSGNNIIGKVGIDQTTPGTTNLVALSSETTKVIGTVNIAAAQTLATVTTVSAVTAITNALPTGANVIGKVSIDQTTPGTTNAVTDTKLPAAAASADGFSNPTVTQIGVENMLYNGVNWDRQRGMSVISTSGDSGAKTVTGNGNLQTNFGNKGLQLVIALGTVTGTTPTAVFKMQNSVDGGTTWVDIPGATTASLTATGNFGISVYPGQAVTAGTTTTGTTATASGIVSRAWRVVWTLGGTTPSFTITSITYNYIPN